MYVAIAGNICSGKTTLTEILSQRLGFRPLYESTRENPYLSDFYRDMANHSFQSQIFFLSCKLAQHEALLSGQNIIQDRTVYEDGIFARALFDAGFMHPRNYETYRKLYESIIEILPHPDRLIYIKASVATILERIKVRNNFGEGTAPLKYLNRLNLLYEEWISAYNLSPVAVVPGDEIAFISEGDVLERLIRGLRL
ncbi:MAG: Deoxyadenosine/deoxycytidine kinase [Firmicutes bacterium]|nr:Deoxyadenosine/deoxycytidine kinase [Bacillota bacterium]